MYKINLCTPTRYSYTYQVQLNRYPTRCIYIMPTRYIYTYKVRLQLVFQRVHQQLQGTYLRCIPTTSSWNPLLYNTPSASAKIRRRHSDISVRYNRFFLYIYRNFLQKDPNPEQHQSEKSDPDQKMVWIRNSSTGCSFCIPMAT